MSRMKSLFAVLVLAAVAGIVPQAHAVVTVEVTIAGSSAEWQTLALGAYSLCGAGCGHWTSASNKVNLTDTRTTPVNVDPGTAWIVFNSTGTKVWSFNKVDSVVGLRCYFARPSCTTSALAADLAGTGANQIASNLWTDGSVDKALPASIVSLFTNGTPVTVAGTDIRPEDGAFAACRVNSSLGAGSFGAGASDGTDGLGYNTNNAAGVCPAAGLSQAHYVGSPILSGYPSSTSAANVLSFNIKGTDPISGTAEPAYSVVNVGAAPIVFVTEKDKGQLANLTNATPQQLQAAFSGTNCDASAFGLPAGAISINLREPLSGTMNTTEATTFRKPTVYGGNILGVSQEENVGANNPLKAQGGTCLAGTGSRYRAIGTGEEVKSVQNSGTNYGFDGIGYAFFSYGNVGALSNQTKYAYITINNVDPIFASYGVQNSTGTGFDPGQPATAANPGLIPAAANTPCAGFPCKESQIWKAIAPSTVGLSFPNVRNGSYPAWSLLRLVSDGTALTNAKALITKSQGFVVTSVPDYIPFAKTIAGGVTDPGLTVVRSHYYQYDGAGTVIGAAVAVNSGTTEAGGDMGGEILSCATTTTCSKTTQNVQGNQGFQVRP
jgi:hypothetical protein